MPSLAALPAAVSGLLGNTTFWLLAAAAWLAYELYRRTFIESYADDAKTIAYVPFWHWVGIELVHDWPVENAAC